MQTNLKRKPQPADEPDTEADRTQPTLARLLLILPFLGLIVSGFYNVAEPRLAGMPFFYWYQIAWIPGTMALLAIVYWFEKR